jgi:urea transport system ATP-binding protein
MLRLEGVDAAYGKSQVLWGIDLEVRPGEAVALLGRNGVGKTTLLRTIVGLHKAERGRVRLRRPDCSAQDHEDVTALGAHQRARLGIGYVPQGRQIFPHLTVAENLEVGLAATQGRKDKQKVPELVFDLFPDLRNMLGRPGGVLSGGQQQQLAIARALVTRPRLLLLDEPTEGIQPSIILEIEEALTRIRRELKVAVLLVEQYLEFAWGFSSAFYVMQKGRIVRKGQTGEENREDTSRLLSL